MTTLKVYAYLSDSHMHDYINQNVHYNLVIALSNLTIALSNLTIALSNLTIALSNLVIVLLY